MNRKQKVKTVSFIKSGFLVALLCCTEEEMRERRGGYAPLQVLKEKKANACQLYWQWPAAVCRKPVLPRLILCLLYVFVSISLSSHLCLSSSPPPFPSLPSVSTCIILLFLNISHLCLHTHTRAPSLPPSLDLALSLPLPTSEWHITTGSNRHGPMAAGPFHPAVQSGNCQHHTTIHKRPLHWN